MLFIIATLPKFVYDTGSIWQGWKDQNLQFCPDM